MIFYEADNLIVYQGDEVPKARPLAFKVSEDGKSCAVKATYANLVALNELDLDTPDPVENYDWPSSPFTGPPFETQKRVTSFCVLNPRCFVVSDARTGKTRASLWAADWLMCHAKKKIRALIVSDINPIYKTWVPEIGEHFIGRRSYEVLHGSCANREKGLSRDADFYLINPAGLIIGAPRRIIEDTPWDDLAEREKSKYGSRRAYETFSGKKRRVRVVSASSVYAGLMEKKFDIVIFDEADNFRNDMSEQAKAARALSKEASYVWLLTATPSPEGPQDAYGLKRLCEPSYKMSYKFWLEKVTRPEGPFRRVPRENSHVMVEELLQPSIRITQDQCFTPTPLKGPVYLRVPLSDEQKRHIRELKRELIIRLKTGGEISAVNEGALRTKLLQISCGAVYDERHVEHIIECTPRLDVFRKLIVSLNRKVIVFAPFTSVVNMLGRAVAGSVVLDQGLSRKAKLELLSKWQMSSGNMPLISHPGPVARGIDLTVADVIIWYSPCDRAGWFAQANERINGINQKRPRWIIAMSGCALEEDIYDTLQGKQELQGLMLRLKEIDL